MTNSVHKITTIPSDEGVHSQMIEANGPKKASNVVIKCSGLNEEKSAKRTQKVSIYYIPCP